MQIYFFNDLPTLFFISDRYRKQTISFFMPKWWFSQFSFGERQVDKLPCWMSHNNTVTCQLIVSHRCFVEEIDPAFWNIANPPSNLDTDNGDPWWILKACPQLASATIDQILTSHSKPFQKGHVTRSWVIHFSSTSLKLNFNVKSHPHFNPFQKGHLTNFHVKIGLSVSGKKTHCTSILVSTPAQEMTLLFSHTKS